MSGESGRFTIQKKMGLCIQVLGAGEMQGGSIPAEILAVFLLIYPVRAASLWPVTTVYTLVTCGTLYSTSAWYFY